MIVDLVEKLADRLIQLLKYKQEKRKELLKEHVIPLFEEFEHVHSAYLESFSRYRDQIVNAQGPNWIPVLQDVILRDNLFSANARSKIKRLAQAGFFDIDEPFVAGICDYVTGIRIIDSVVRNKDPQRWRSSFSEALDGIADGTWTFAEGGFSLGKKEIESNKKKVLALYPISQKIGKEDAAKRAFALHALDLIVSDMQKQYDIVCSAYAKLRKTLST